MHGFFKEIFEYHYYFNQKLINQLEENSEKLHEKAFSLFCHILNSHQIWNARILNKETLDVFDLYSFEKCRKIDNENFRDTLEVLDNYDLGEIIQYKNTKGLAYTNSIRDIYFHLSNHNSHHKGQIIFLIRQAGIDPIITDYIFYKRSNENRIR